MTTTNTVPVRIDFEDIPETITQVLKMAKDTLEEFLQKASSHGFPLERCVALVITHRIHSQLQLSMTKARRKSLAAYISRKPQSCESH